MPIISSAFQPPFLLQNGHLQTLIPALFRKYDASVYVRERISTPDDDFLDLDWIKSGSEKLVILFHGLEGSSSSTSVVQMARFLAKNGYDILVMNFRSCNGEMNRQLRFYHSGETSDPGFVIQKAIDSRQYQEISLIGFSLGGNVLLKYLGEQGSSISPFIKSSVAISTPCDLESSAYYLNRWSARIYLNNFLKSLKTKIREKHRLMPERLSITDLDKVKTFHDFDNFYTGPMHGFKDAHDYYLKSSSKFYLEHISIPTLMLSAHNDPFLPQECYPKEIASNHPNLYLEMPESGGHVGFFSGNLNGTYWSERRILAFFLNS